MLEYAVNTLTKTILWRRGAFRHWNIIIAFHLIRSSRRRPFWHNYIIIIV